MARARWGCVAFSKVQSFSAWLSGVMEATGRDRSHGMEHFERVRQLSLKIAEEELDLTSDESLVLQLAALCHDVLDHKYVTSQKLYGELKTELLEALRNVACLQDHQAEEVLLISENISLSKEKRRELQLQQLTERGLLSFRDVVSDADKVDALGRQGIVRLAQYQLALNGVACLTPAYLRDLANKHLLERFFYLRTDAGVRMAMPAYLELEAIVASEDLLLEVIHEVIQEMSDREGTVAIVSP